MRLACVTLEVSHSGYCAWRRRPESPGATRRAELAQKIREVHEQPARRALLERGERVCRDTVARLTKAVGIRHLTDRAFWVRATNSDHPLPVAPNLLDRRFQARTLNRIRLNDITYIRTDEGFLFLADVMDLCSRRIVGWSMGEHLRAELVCEALQARRPLPGLLHDSDRVCGTPAGNTSLCVGGAGSLSA